MTTRQSAECLRCLGTRIVYTCADQSACDEACEKAPCPECRPRQSADLNDAQEGT